MVYVERMTRSIASAILCRRKDPMLRRESNGFESGVHLEL